MKVDDVYWDFLKHGINLCSRRLLPLHRRNAHARVRHLFINATHVPALHLPSPNQPTARTLTRFCAAKTEFINPTYPPLPLSGVLFTINTRARTPPPFPCASVSTRMWPVADAWMLERVVVVVGWRRLMSVGWV